MGFSAIADVVGGSLLGDAAATTAGGFALGGLGGGAVATDAALAAGAGLSGTAAADMALGGVGASTLADAAPVGFTPSGSGGTSLSSILGGASQLAGGLKTLAGTGVSTGQADPFAQYRPYFGQQLYNLFQNPNAVTQMPGYQFGLQQAMQGLQAGQARQGNLVSGGALAQAGQLQQGYGLQQLSNWINTLSPLAGATQLPGQGAQAAQGIGTSNIAGTLGGLQAVSGGLGQLYSLVS